MVIIAIAIAIASSSAAAAAVRLIVVATTAAHDVTEMCRRAHPISSRLRLWLWLHGEGGCRFKRALRRPQLTSLPPSQQQH